MAQSFVSIKMPDCSLTGFLVEENEDMKSSLRTALESSKASAEQFLITHVVSKMYWVSLTESLDDEDGISHRFLVEASNAKDALSKVLIDNPELSNAEDIRIEEEKD